MEVGIRCGRRKGSWVTGGERQAVRGEQRVSRRRVRVAVPGEGAEGKLRGERVRREHRKFRGRLERLKHGGRGWPDSADEDGGWRRESEIAGLASDCLGNGVDPLELQPTADWNRWPAKPGEGSRRRKWRTNSDCSRRRFALVGGRPCGGGLPAEEPAESRLDRKQRLALENHGAGAQNTGGRLEAPWHGLERVERRGHDG